MISGDISWTWHARSKMKHYRLTEARVKRVIRHPARMEEGILERAVAVMQPASGLYGPTARGAGGKNYSEIWVMYILDGGGSFGVSRPRRARSAPAADLALSRPKDSPHKAENQASFGLQGLGRESASTAADGLFRGRKLVKVITAWRYPGKAPERDPVPEEILREIRKLF